MIKISTAKPAYDAAGQGRRLIGWNPGASGPVKTIESGQATLRNRARDAARNEPIAAAIIRSWVSSLVGAGITCRSNLDPDMRHALDALWRDWLPQADADGACGDFYGLQSLAVRSFIESGEVFIRLRPRLPIDDLVVPLQVQILESDMLPAIDRLAENGNEIIQGIEINAIGQRVAYHFLKAHPGDGRGDTSSTTRVAAEYVSHVFAPERPGQLRGVSVLAPILASLKNLGDFIDATAERAKLSNLLVGFVTRPPSSGDATIDPVTGRSVNPDYDGTPMAGLEPGTMQELMPGESVTFSDPPQPGADFAEFVRTQISQIAAGVGGMPTEYLTGDLRDVSDRTLRVSLNEWRRVCESVQWQIIIPKVCAFVRNAWADAAVMAGVLTGDEGRAAKLCEWTPPRHRHLHPTQDVQGLKLEIDAGLRSRSSVISEYGYDAIDVDAERAGDATREAELGLSSDESKLAEAEYQKLLAEADAAQQQANAAKATAAQARTSADRIKIERATAQAVHGFTVAKAKDEAAAAKLDLQAAKFGLAELRGEK